MECCRGLDISITLFLLIMVVSSQYVVSSLESGENLRGRQKRSLQFYHDSVVLNKILKNTTVKAPIKNANSLRYRRKLQDQYRRHYPITNMKTLPADDSLKHDFYSEKLERTLGNVPIQRGRRDNAQNKRVQGHGNQPIPPIPIVLTNTVRRPRIPSLPSNAVLAARVQDIEEIFRILARRDGQFLEQMLSLKSAIDRLYSIFEYMGVANMPLAQREAAIRQVVRRAYRIDTQKLIKRKRRRKKFANA